jgi:hypothetical protein
VSPICEHVPFAEWTIAMLQFRTPDGPAFHPLAPLVLRTRKGPEADQFLYLFSVNRSNKRISLITSAVEILLSAYFWIRLPEIPQANAIRYLVLYFGTMILLFVLRMFLWGAVMRYRVSDLQVEGTAPFVFAFEWIACFLSMATSIALFMGRFAQGGDIYSEVVIFALCVVAFLPTVLLARARFLISGNG